jgi:5-methylcytosine-specific restriction endonuclease McrA
MSISEPVYSRICSNCGGSFIGRCCKPCKNSKAKAWRDANPEKAKAATLKWRSKNIEKVRATSMAFYANNLEQAKSWNKAWRVKNAEGCKASGAKNYSENSGRYKAFSAAYRAENPDSVKQATAEWRRLNPEKVKLYSKAWAAANIEKVRMSSRNRRALRLRNGGKLSDGLADKLFLLQRGKCACCGDLLGENYHMDHIIPLSRGGPNTDENTQLLTRRCNLQKKAKDPIDFMQSRGFLL